jgi:hypothetical protein
MKRAAAFTLALALVLAASTGRADTFAAGSYIIPMDTTYQDVGMLKAYGLVYNLVRRGIPVRWVVDPAKAYQGTDFTASAVDLRTMAQIANYGYRGGPFVIDSANAAAALPYIQAWWAANPSVKVHSATAPFSGTVAKVLVVAPRIAVLADGNQAIAVSYLNAAGIPDSQGNPWPATSPDLLTPARVAGPTTTNHQDGALFDANGVPLFCQMLSMDWSVASAAASPEPGDRLGGAELPHPADALLRGESSGRRLREHGPPLDDRWAAGSASTHIGRLLQSDEPLRADRRRLQDRRREPAVVRAGTCERVQGGRDRDAQRTRGRAGRARRVDDRLPRRQLPADCGHVRLGRQGELPRRAPVHDQHADFDEPQHAGREALPQLALRLAVLEPSRGQVASASGNRDAARVRPVCGHGDARLRRRVEQVHAAVESVNGYFQQLQ